MIFLYSIDYISATFVLTMRLRFCNLHTWTTGKAGNTAPRGQVPTPTRRTYRLSGREALIDRGVGAKEAPPQARTRLTRAVGEVTNPTGRLPAKEFDNRFRFHTAAQRWAAGMEAETPTPDRQRPQDAVFSILEITTGRCRDWGPENCLCCTRQAVFT